MSVEKVRSFFAQRGREGDILEFDVSSATVELAAAAVGCAPSRIAKTLSFSAEDGCILVVCAGDAKIDNAKFKAQFHTKAKMLTHEEAHSLLVGCLPSPVFHRFSRRRQLQLRH